MYTNIDINDCIKQVSTYLATTWDVMNATTSLKQYGDCNAKQTYAVRRPRFSSDPWGSYGHVTYPTIANLYVAIYKQLHILLLLQKYLPFYKIYNRFFIWLHDEDPTTNANSWMDFKTIVNVSGLSWTFDNPCNKLVFMDMTIQNKEGKTVTALYVKPLLLYQYIPPNLCHSPGVLTGLV